MYKCNVKVTKPFFQGNDVTLEDKMANLHATLTRIREESESQIKKLKKESEDASKTIEKLQLQLKQQSDYELIKREMQ